MAKNGNVETMASIMVPEGRDSPFERVLWMPMNARTHSLSLSSFRRHLSDTQSGCLRKIYFLFINTVYFMLYYCCYYYYYRTKQVMSDSIHGWWAANVRDHRNEHCTIWRRPKNIINNTTFCFVSNGNVFASSSCAAIHFQMNLWRRCCCASHVLHFLIAHSFRRRFFFFDELVTSSETHCSEHNFNLPRGVFVHVVDNRKRKLVKTVNTQMMMGESDWLACGKIFALIKQHECEWGVFYCWDESMRTFFASVSPPVPEK